MSIAPCSTLAFAQIVWSVLWQWIEVTGGDNGILQVWPDHWARGVHVYYSLVLILSALCVLLLWRILDLPFGYALRAARDSSSRQSRSEFRSFAFNGQRSSCQV